MMAAPSERIPSTMHGGGSAWSITNTGSINLVHYENKYPNYSNEAEGYKWVVAHEFGHILGLSDAYGREASMEAAVTLLEVPEEDIMRQQRGTVNTNTIEMVLEAWSTNTWQYFDGHYTHETSSAIRFR